MMTLQKKIDLEKALQIALEKDRQDDVSRICKQLCREVPQKSPMTGRWLDRLDMFPCGC